MAGFESGAAWLPRPGLRIAMPAAFRYLPALSRRIPVVFFYPVQGPSQPAQHDDLISLFFVQDIAHLRSLTPRLISMSGRPSYMAGFEVTAYGRFWGDHRGCSIHPGFGTLGLPSESVDALL